MGVRLTFQCGTRKFPEDQPQARETLFFVWKSGDLAKQAPNHALIWLDRCVKKAPVQKLKGLAFCGTTGGVATPEVAEPIDQSAEEAARRESRRRAVNVVNQEIVNGRNNGCSGVGSRPRAR